MSSRRIQKNPRINTSHWRSWGHAFLSKQKLLYSNEKAERSHQESNQILRSEPQYAPPQARAISSREKIAQIVEIRRQIRRSDDFRKGSPSSSESSQVMRKQGSHFRVQVFSLSTTAERRDFSSSSMRWKEKGEAEVRDAGTWRRLSWESGNRLQGEEEICCNDG